MDNRFYKNKFILFISIALFLILILPVIDAQPYNGQYIKGATYTKCGLSGASCNTGDTKIRAWNTGYGRNFGWSETANGCTAWEGSNNRGNPGCCVECQKSDQFLGCFNNQDQPVNLGTIPKNTSFKYYSTATSDRNNAVTEPDTNTGACSCISGGVAGGAKCCGDDSQDQFCNGNLEGCFNSEYYSDPDQNQFICESCTQGTWASSQCCGDDNNENFCSGNNAGCFNAQFFNDPDSNQFICETCAQGKWLNGKCCGDDSLQDNFDGGANISSCYQGKIILNCQQPVNNPSVLNEDGRLSTCTSNEGEKCSLKCSNSLFCSYTGSWLPTQGKTRNQASTWPLDTNIKTECCQQQQCWNGSVCIENQFTSPISKDYSGYRCINGAWKKAELLCVAEDCETRGYCPEAGQCLVSLDGNVNDNNNPSGNPQCISTGQYIKDNYCESGNWTSRTKFVALQLLSLPAAGNYILFCDSADNALNYAKYLVGQETAENYIAGKANNFCVISYENKIVFGTSLNQGINDANLPFLSLLGISSCNEANDNNYNPCDNSKKAWYNKNLKTVIYSKDAIDLRPLNFFESFVNFLKSPFTTIANLIKGKVSEPPFDNSYISSLKKFDKLYLNRAGNKAIRGTMEGLQFKNMLIEYQSFDTDICSFVDKFGQTTSDAGSGIVCRKDGNNYYVLAQGSTFTTLNPNIIWTDLTSSLRIR